MPVSYVLYCCSCFGAELVPVRTSFIQPYQTQGSMRILQRMLHAQLFEYTPDRVIRIIALSPLSDEESIVELEASATMGTFGPGPALTPYAANIFLSSSFCEVVVHGNSTDLLGDGLGVGLVSTLPSGCW